MDVSHVGKIAATACQCRHIFTKSVYRDDNDANMSKPAPFPPNVPFPELKPPPQVPNPLPLPPPAVPQPVPNAPGTETKPERDIDQTKDTGACPLPDGDTRYKEYPTHGKRKSKPQRRCSDGGKPTVERVLERTQVGCFVLEYRFGRKNDQFFDVDIVKTWADEQGYSRTGGDGWQKIVLVSEGIRADEITERDRQLLPESQQRLKFVDFMIDQFMGQDVRYFCIYRIFQERRVPGKCTCPDGSPCRSASKPA